MFSNKKYLNKLGFKNYSEDIEVLGFMRLLINLAFRMFLSILTFFTIALFIYFYFKLKVTIIILGLITGVFIGAILVYYKLKRDYEN